jgi:hypothetical protein
VSYLVGTRTGNHRFANQRLIPNGFNEFPIGTLWNERQSQAQLLPKLLSDMRKPIRDEAARRSAATGAFFLVAQ